MRNNGGGSLIDAVDISGRFVDSGPVVQVKNSYGAKRILEDRTNGVSFSGAMVVLVNQFSASASEIVAAALQDYNRAIIVGGKHTHGKGTVQTILDLNENIPLLHLKKYDDLGALKVTIQKFYRINGGSTQYRGVVPDVILPSLFQHLESGEQYLDYSLTWDQVKPVSYHALSKQDLHLDEIKKRSEQRVNNAESFIAISEEAIRATARRDETEISLNIDKMMAKRQELQEAQDKLEKVYKNYKAEGESEEDTNEPTLTAEEEFEQWVEGVKDDPYVQEAQNILQDLNMLN